MKKLAVTTAILIMTLLLIPGAAYAREGICGYEGGISSGENPGKTTYDYQEVSFVSGKPVVFKGTMTIKKQQRQGKTTTTYTYSLKNGSDTLSRTLVFDTTPATAGNGQTTETAALAKQASETIKIGGKTYTLKTNGYDFTRSNLIDPRPAINYHAGSIWSRKVYQVGAASNGDTVTVECTGDYYGYDQYWGNAESIILNYTIEGDMESSGDKWGGAATVAISATSAERIEYQKNKPDQISFPGGFVQTRTNSGILEYSCTLNEFDSKGISTDNMITYKDSLKLETFPVQKRLPSVESRSFAGHPAENAISLMFGLEVFRGNAASFMPDQYMSRAEFAAAMVQIAREVPPDPALAVRTAYASSRTSKKATVVSPYDDVSIDNAYFAQIKSAYDRGMLGGVGNKLFKPNSAISKADAMVAIVRALGLESLAPPPAAVTSFRDNDLIPAYARNAAYVAKKIGLLQPDARGNMNPAEKLTKAEGSVLFENLVKYLQNGILKDYRERLVNY